MAAALRRALGAEVEIRPGARGEFTVWLGERKVLDTSKTGEFPSDEDAIAAARAALGA